MKRCWLVLIPAVFLLLINITVAAEQPTVAAAVPDGDRMVQRQQRVREPQNEIDALAQQFDALKEAPGLPPGVIDRNSPLLSEPPGNMPFSFEQPNEPRVVPRSPFGDPRPYQYNGMTFWWIPLSTGTARLESPARPLGSVEFSQAK